MTILQSIDPFQPIITTENQKNDKNVETKEPKVKTKENEQSNIMFQPTSILKNPTRERILKDSAKTRPTKLHKHSRTHNLYSEKYRTTRNKRKQSLKNSSYKSRNNLFDTDLITPNIEFSYISALTILDICNDLIASGKMKPEKIVNVAKIYAQLSEYISLHKISK